MIWRALRPHAAIALSAVSLPAMAAEPAPDTPAPPPADTPAPPTAPKPAPPTPEPPAPVMPTSPAVEKDESEAEEDPSVLFQEPFYGFYLTVRNTTRWIRGDDLDAALGPDTRLIRNTLAFRPLIPLPLGSTGLFLQPYVPLTYAELPSPPLEQDSAFGLNDCALFTSWVPFPRQAVLWGLGPTFIFPTATDENLGEKHFQMGPAGGVLIFPGRALIGAIVEQWWSIGGDAPATNQMHIQYFLTQRVGAGWQIGMSPDVLIDWTADDGEKLTLPVGLGVSKAWLIGKQPLRVGVELDYSIVRPDAVGQEWSLRIDLEPLLLLREPRKAQPPAAAFTGAPLTRL